VGVSVIAVLVSSLVLYSTYRNRLDNVLDQFDDRLDAQNFETTFVYNRQGSEVMYQWVGEGRRERVSLDEIPDVVINATIALEDDTFYDNIGVDVPSIIRASRDYVQHGGIVSGASTITQQLVRHVLFDEEYRYERTLQRKLDEALLAIMLTRKMSKDEILELYLNEINYGNRAYGIEAAAQVYFGKSARELELHEAALLAALPQAPGIWNPLNPDPEIRQLIVNRQYLVLDLMVDKGYITQQEATAAKQRTLIFAEQRPDICPATGMSPVNEREPGLLAAHFEVFVQDQLTALFVSRYEQEGYVREDAEQLAEQVISEGGLHVYTTLDLEMQRQASQAAETQVAALRNQYNLTNSAVVVINPPTGEVYAMVGSVNFCDPEIDGQVNVTLAQRQPGSTMKPFTYSSAMEHGWTASSIIWDTNVSIDIPGSGVYTPENYDNRQHGPVHVRDALANSYNIPAIQTMRFIGVDSLLELMHRFGVNSLNRDPSEYGLSLTLGGGDVTLIELTNAYAVFARNGTYVPTTGIRCVVDSDGNILYEYQDGCPRGNETGETRYAVAAPRTVLDSRVAYVINDILSDNVARSPAMGSNSPLNTNFTTAVKTGTTNDFRDNWTVGYTPDLAIGVWSGNSNNDPMNNISGLQGAAPIWRDTMHALYSFGIFPNSSFTQPSGLYREDVCRASSLRDPATSCGAFRSEWFFDGGVLIPNAQGQLVPPPLPPPAQQQSSEFGPQLEEVQPGIILTYVRPITPDQANILVAQNPGSVPQKYCLVPVEVLGSVPDAQQQLFIDAPDNPDSARGAYRYALSPNINYAILPQFPCTPETIVGGSLPTSAGIPGDYEVNPTSSDPARTAAIYCKPDGSIDVWQVVNSQGVPAFTATPIDIATVPSRPAANTLIKSDGQGDMGVRLYRLTSGQFQINAPRGSDPNGYVFIWNGCGTP
jgi:membrane peptidoglycan carboxypeptidase